MLHLGAVELVQGWEANRRASHVAAAVADLVAQNRTVTDADLADILRAGQVLMQPFTANNLGQRVASVSASSSGAVSVNWTATSNWNQGGVASVPAGYLAANESVIVTDIVYTQPALFGIALPSSVVIQKHAYVRPRLSSQVQKG
jgi:Flp pilus assembly protein TadG